MQTFLANPKVIEYLMHTPPASLSNLEIDDDYMHVGQVIKQMVDNGKITELLLNKNGMITIIP